MVTETAIAEDLSSKKISTADTMDLTSSESSSPNKEHAARYRANMDTDDSLPGGIPGVIYARRVSQRTPETSMSRFLALLPYTDKHE